MTCMVQGTNTLVNVFPGPRDFCKPQWWSQELGELWIFFP